MKDKKISEYYAELGRKGGLATGRVRDHLSKAGSKGGKKTAQKGPEFYRELQRKSAESRRKKRGFDKSE